MRRLSKKESCLQVKTKWANLLSVCFIAVLFFACEPQDSLSLSYTEQQVQQDFALHKIQFTDAKHGIAMGGDEYEFGIVQTTIDGGLTWSLDTISKKSIYDFDIVEDTICSAGVRGYLTYMEKGLPWQELRPGEPLNAKGIVKLEDGYIVVGGVAFSFGYIMRLSSSLDLLEYTPYTVEFNAVERSSNNVLHAVGYGQICRSENAGVTWTVNEQVGDDYKDVFFINESIGWVVGVAGSILKTIDGGRSWQTLNKPRVQSKLPFNSIFFTNEDDGMAVGDDGLVWATADGGANWSVLESVPNYDFNDIFIDEEIAWLVSQEGHIVRLFL